MSDGPITRAAERLFNQDHRKSALGCGCDWETVKSKAAQIPISLSGSQLFTTDAKTRKGYPVFTGALMYFPDALAALANVSKMGNDQHNPGEPLHWAREKSTDQMDTATRHMMDHGTGYTKDTDGAYHLAKAAWRILAELQLTIEKEREGQ